MKIAQSHFRVCCGTARGLELHCQCLGSPGPPHRSSMLRLVSLMMLLAPSTLFTVDKVSVVSLRHRRIRSRASRVKPGSKLRSCTSTVRKSIDQIGSVAAAPVAAFLRLTDATSHIHKSPWIVPLHPFPYSLEQSSRCSLLDFASIHARSQCCGRLIGSIILSYIFKSSCNHRLCLCARRLAAP